MKIIVSMSGMSSRFTNAGYTIPKFMIEIDGKRVIEHIIDLYPKNSDFLFIINNKHAEDDDILNFLQNLSLPNYTFVSVPVHKKGPVFSIQNFEDCIDDDEQVIINYCDFSMDWDYDNFEKFVNETECDGCVVSYTGFHPHMLGSDNYAFCKVNNDNKILEIREKQPFTDDKMSEYASTGTYYFKKGTYVKKYFKKLMDEDIKVNDEYYVSMVYNLLIKDDLNSYVYEVPHMLQWGTPFDLSEYKQWSDYFRRIIYGQNQVTLNNCYTLLPIAGLGSRFRKEGYLDHKPYIFVNGHHMMSRSLKCLPKTDTTIIGALEKYKGMKDLNNYGDLIWIDKVLSGQACTVERMLDRVEDENKSILISACDNGMLYDEIELQSLTDSDVIVWTFRNNHTTYRKPNSYAWVETDGEYVKNVSVKNFIGDDPLKEHAIVGTFWFKNKSIYLNSLRRLYDRKGMVNNEYYIDALINDAINIGYKVKYFEVEKYICWGTPDDLKTYQYWQEFFNKVDWHPYKYQKDYFTN